MDKALWPDRCGKAKHVKIPMETPSVFGRKGWGPKNNSPWCKLGRGGKLQKETPWGAKLEEGGCYLLVRLQREGSLIHVVGIPCDEEDVRLGPRIEARLEKIWGFMLGLLSEMANQKSGRVIQLSLTRDERNWC